VSAKHASNTIYRYPFSKQHLSLNSRLYIRLPKPEIDESDGQINEESILILIPLN
jgi:hypothetical protein